MANTFLFIQKLTLASPVATLEFTSIPQTFTDLVLLLSARATGNNDFGVYVSINGVTTDFSGKYMNGPTPSAPGTGTLARYIGSVGGNVYFTSGKLYFPNYAGSTVKSFSSAFINGRYNQAGNQLNLVSGNRSNTSAISSVSLTIDGGTTFTTDSTAYLYGISNA